jgi:hypothetical protein
MNPADYEKALKESQEAILTLTRKKTEVVAKIDAMIEREVDKYRALALGRPAEVSAPAAPTLQEPKVTPGQVIPIGDDSLKTRIFKYLGKYGDDKTPEQMADAIGEPTVRRVELCLRDCRAKDKLFEKPKNRHWTRNQAGREFSAKVLGGSSQNKPATEQAMTIDK